MLDKEKDIEHLYIAKCSKYTAEQLTPNLRALLMCEAVEETNLMYATLTQFLK